MTSNNHQGNGLVEGLAYTIYLKNGRSVYNAVYNHCAVSGKHYFSKGDDIYSIEDLLSHSMQGREINADMPPQILTDDYCGHPIEVTFTSVYPQNEAPKIPDSIYDIIHEALKENITDGAFTEEDTGDNLDIWEGDNSEKSKSVYTVVAGSWRVIELNFHLMSQIIMWWNNHHTPDTFSLELFIRYFGKDAGTEYHRQWLDRKENLMDMLGCFVSEREDGQKFCNMVMGQVAEYEKTVSDGKE